MRGRVPLRPESEQLHEDLLTHSQEMINKQRLFCQRCSIFQAFNDYLTCAASIQIEPKICVDVLSMFIFYSRLYPETFEERNLEHISEVCDPAICNIHFSRMSNILENIQQLFRPRQLVFLLPKQEPFTQFTRTTFNQIHTLIQSRLYTPNKSSKIKNKWGLADPTRIFEQIKAICYDSMQGIRDDYDCQVEVGVLEYPWLNEEVLDDDLCGAQMWCLSNQGFLCLSWNPSCLRHMPRMQVIIGLNIFQLYNFNKIHEVELMQGLQQSLRYEQNPIQCLTKQEIFMQENQALHYSFNLLLSNWTNNDSISVMASEQAQISILQLHMPLFEYDHQTLVDLREARLLLFPMLVRKIFVTEVLMEFHPVIRDSVVAPKKEITRLVYERDLRGEDLEPAMHQIWMNYCWTFYVNELTQKLFEQYLKVGKKFFTLVQKSKSRKHSTEKRLQSTAESQENQRVTAKVDPRVVRKLLPEPQQDALRPASTTQYESDIDQQ